MKKITFCILILALFILCPTSGKAWGRLGHATIAQIAENHLTPRAKANIMRYTKGEHLASFSSYMDEVVKTPPFDVELAGWHASIANEKCQSPLYVRKAYRNCRDAVTGLDFWKEMLEDYPQVNDSVVFLGIKCITHMVGDIHCPVHVRFTDNLNDGKYDVVFRTKTVNINVNLHHVWDTSIISHAHSGWKYEQYAEYLDTWKEKDIKKVSKGWARQWFESIATDVRPWAMNNNVKVNQVLGQEYVDENIEFCELLMRKAGYRLAAALNTIFDK